MLLSIFWSCSPISVILIWSVNNHLWLNSKFLMTITITWNIVHVNLSPSSKAVHPFTFEQLLSSHVFYCTHNFFTTHWNSWSVGPIKTKVKVLCQINFDEVGPLISGTLKFGDLFSVTWQSFSSHYCQFS